MSPKTQNGSASSAPDSMYRDASDSLRDRMEPEELLKLTAYPKILLIDDDPLFGQIMNRVVTSCGAEMMFCESAESFGKIKKWDFDVAVIDYNLGSVTGFDLARYMEKHLDRNIPIVLVSESQQKSVKRWPGNIREFVHKSLGPIAVLDAVLEAFEVTKLHAAMGSFSLN